MGIDFFEQQDSARRQTTRLIVMTVLAVIFIVIAVYAAVTGILLAESGSGPSGAAQVIDGGRFALVATLVLLVIASGSLYKVAMLSQGGEGIALMLGGRLVDPNTTDLSERKLLNVVEEMAIASGIPVPPVYLLDHEPGINAFAAGFSPTDAVIGVNQGTIQHLTRDQLQGVIGHEFSHILNGDMRLNLRLIGLIHGILVIALIGQLIIRLTPNSRISVRSDSKDSSAGTELAIFLGGLALIMIGSLGVLLGRIIKCAISRQREYLADASAVQFTRNPMGLADALKKIGGLKEGSKFESPNAEQACHMFFGQGVLSFNRLLATHPPLSARIQRLDPSFHGEFAEVRSDEQVDDSAELQVGLAARASESPANHGPQAFGASAVIDSIGNPTLRHVEYANTFLEALPPLLDSAIRDPFASRAVIYALLIDKDPEIRRQQLAGLQEKSLPDTAGLVLKLLPSVAALGEPARVPLADLAFPALRMLTQPQYRRFRADLEDLIKADHRVTLFEYTLKRMVIRNLDQIHSPHPPLEIQYRDFERVRDEAIVLLGTLARLGHSSPIEIEKAFEVGVSRLPKNPRGSGKTYIPIEESCTMVDIDRALERLARSTPTIKKQVLDACAAAIASDGQLTQGEGELLRAIADSLECPMPPLLGS